MSDLTCPHCHQSVPMGAAVCRGCQADVAYGAPRYAWIVVTIASTLLGVKTATLLPASLEPVAWGVGIGALIAGGVLVRRLCKNRIRFRRIYHTR